MIFSKSSASDDSNRRSTHSIKKQANIRHIKKTRLHCTQEKSLNNIVSQVG